jgi:hypothetical protein
MQEERDRLCPAMVVATTLPFFARAATIVEEAWHGLDRMAEALDQCAALSADSSDRAVLELLIGGMHELARRLEQTEVALSAYLPTP